jgi:flavin reductase (DIM6/NTAB) family NADH-FMN oxidoreductase RutF
MAVDAEAFRAALRCWPSGVTILTSRAGDAIHGMTVSAFASVSLEPPLVLVCAEKTTITNGVIEKGGVFAANVLAADQQELSNRFASKKDEHRRFDGVAWTQAVTGAPILSGVVTALDCRVTAAHDAGDHVIYVGSVEAVVPGEGKPLVYHDSAYRRLA